MANIDDYILNQKPEIAAIMEYLRQLIHSCSPKITEKIRYKIPFFGGNKMICYLNPKKNAVDFGFCKGYELSNVQGLLNGDERNTVKVISISSIEEINQMELREIINEAIILDETQK